MPGPSLRIGEVAKRAGVSVDAVRFYERRGVLPPAERRPSGYRTYTEEAVERIRLTKALQALGFTLEEIVDAFGAPNATCASERWRFEQVLDRIDANLAELGRVRRDVIRVLETVHAGHCVVCDGRFTDRRPRDDKSARGKEDQPMR